MASIYKGKEYQFSADDGTPLNGGLLYSYVTTTTTAKNTYPTETDALAGTNANPNPVVLDADGRSPAMIWISGRHRFILKTSAGVTIADDDPVEDVVTASDAQDNSPTWGGAAGGTANAMTFTFSPALTAYTAGQILRGRVATDNSSSVTVNCNGVGAKALVKRDAAALISGDLQAGDIIEFCYDATSDHFELVSAGHVPQFVSNGIAGAQGLAAVRVYDISASPYTWTKPANLSFVTVEVVGGGGGGGGAATNNGASGSGGGGGGYSLKKIAAASLGATETVTIGAAGSAGANTGGNGGNGGNTTFGAHCTGGGGTGGTGSTVASASNAGGAGGTATGGDLNLIGGNGFASLADSVPVTFSSGRGGSAGHGFGAGGREIASATGAAGVAGENYGGGGSGGRRGSGAANNAGGAGAAGLCVVREYV